MATPPLLKILFLTYEYPHSSREAVVSGEVKNPYSLIREMIGRGHEVTVISVPFLSQNPSTVRRRDDADGAAAVFDVPEGKGVAVVRYLWRAYRVARFLRKNISSAFDVIHAEAPALALGVLWASRSNKGLRNVPLVTTGHGTNLPEADADAKVNLRQRLRIANARLVLPVDRKAFQQSNVVISVSEFQRRELAALYGVPAEKIAVIHNGIDVRRYRAGIRTSSSFGPRLLFVGRLVPKKGVQHLLRALPLIRQSHPGTKLDIVGGSPIFDTYGDVLRQFAAQEGVAEFVTWHSSVPEDELPNHYASADVAIFPSEGYESLPTVILEAMAAGVPVVATRLWGTPEALGDSHPGLVPEGDVAALAQAVVKFLDSPHLRSEIIDTQRRRVDAFDIAVVADLHEKVYR